MYLRTARALVLVLVAATASIAAAAPPVTIQGDGLSITLAVAPSPPVRRERTTFEIAVQDEAGQAVTGARVSLDLRMAAMAMAENRQRVTERGGGRYVAVGTCSMAGEWVAVVEVVTRELRRARVEFPVRVR